MKHSEETRELSALQNYTFMFEKHHDAIFVMDLEGCIIYNNQSASKLFGYYKEEMMNTSYNQIVSSKELETFQYFFCQTLDEKTHEFELAIDCEQRGTVELRLMMVPNVMKEHIASITVFIKDITKQQDPEMGKHQEELSVSFIENNRDPILLLDLDAIIILANQRFSQLLGWRKENLEGFHIFRCPSIPPHLIQQMKDYYHRVVTSQFNANSITNTDITTLETIRITTDDRTYHMVISITPIHDQSGEICNWAVHLRDITGQKEAEASNLRAEKWLAAGQIAAGVAQEINTPLKTLKGLTKLIGTSRDRLVNMDQYLDVMMRELNQIETFVSDELSILGTTEIKDYKMTNVNPIIRDVIRSLKTHAMVNNVKIKFDHDEATVIWCVEDLLKQAFLNVIQNGIEAMKTGGILDVSITSCENKIEIRVVDQGVGIREDQLSKLGEPLYFKEKGFGLGLMLTYKIVEQHQGEVTIQSKIGEGTEVKMSFHITN